MNYYSFTDAGICRRTLTALPGKQPFEQHINQIMDYSFYWFIALRDYLLFTGDSGFIGKIYPTAKAFMDFCLSQSNENLLMYNKPHYWIFVDRADMEKEGALCVEQVLFCAALKSMAEIASAAGKALEAEHYTGLSKQLMEEKKNLPGRRQGLLYPQHRRLRRLHRHHALREYIRAYVFACRRG